MQYPERFVLPGSERQLPDGHVRVGDVDRDERAAVTVYVVAPQEQVRDTLQRTGLLNTVVVVEQYLPAT